MFQGATLHGLAASEVALPLFGVRLNVSRQCWRVCALVSAERTRLPDRRFLRPRPTNARGLSASAARFVMASLAGCVVETFRHEADSVLSIGRCASDA